MGAAAQILARLSPLEGPPRVSGRARLLRRSLWPCRARIPLRLVTTSTRFAPFAPLLSARTPSLLRPLLRFVPGSYRLPLVPCSSLAAPSSCTLHFVLFFLCHLSAFISFPSSSPDSHVSSTCVCSHFCISHFSLSICFFVFSVSPSLEARKPLSARTNMSYRTQSVDRGDCIRGFSERARQFGPMRCPRSVAL